MVPVTVTIVNSTENVNPAFSARFKTQESHAQMSFSFLFFLIFFNWSYEHTG